MALPMRKLPICTNKGGAAKFVHAADWIFVCSGSMRSATQR